MDDVWLGHGATHADVEACLKALSLQGSDRPPPLLGVFASAEAPRLLLASRALLDHFEVRSGEALEGRLLRGNDPGARRLASLCQTLALEGAPRLERLRFFIGPGTEIITFLCRRIPATDAPLFIAAALGLRVPATQSTLLPRTGAVVPAAAVTEPAERRPAVSQTTAQADARPAAVAVNASPMSAPSSPMSAPASSMSVQAIQATLRARWPASRTVRFLWQSDADMICTQVTSPLSDVVGANADIVGRDLMGLAPQIDPTGRLSNALAAKQTWSGLEVTWPIADAPAAVSVGLGAIPAVDRDRGFDGYRGYGVINLERLETRAPSRFSAPPAPDRTAPPRTEAQAPERDEPADVIPANVVRFPGSRALSAEDQQAFTAIGAELREETGLAKTGFNPLGPAKTAHAANPESAPAPDAEPSAKDRRAEEIARHGLAILDRLAIGLLVSRDNVPIFANRHLLDGLGFADEDALHAAGGMRHLFGGQPGNVTGSEAVGVRGRDDRIIATNARMQTIEWDGLPATLLTLFPAADPAAAPKPSSSPGEQPVPAPRSDDPEARELRAILETATDGVAVMDAECNVVALNRSGEALFGCDRSEVIGKPFLSLFAPHNQSLAADYLNGLKSDPTKRLLNDGREILIKAHQGATIPVFMTLGRLAPPEGTDERPRFCALFRDLTHWKKVERDLETAKHDAERANALKTDFLAKVSHEVRTPLNAIIGFAEVMMEERFGPIGTERYKDYLRDIHGSGTHVMSLVNDLLDLSKIEAGKMELAVEPIDVNKIIGECAALMQPQASRERIIMRLSLAPGLPQIRADERSLRQIVLNILSNAVKFNEAGGQVIVATARTEGGTVVIRIRDTGIGMSDDDIAAALEPFRQLATTREANGGGTGLGLPLTKALVEANQATFSIRSKLDQGTLVEVAFPAARVMAG